MGFGTEILRAEQALGGPRGGDQGFPESLGLLNMRALGLPLSGDPQP
ncbi:MAG: hypothetical protein GY859_40080 [Desulfobacterales bacterium]|nr:hypothetical protein [Desulfobacterales bacterium]